MKRTIERVALVAGYIVAGLMLAGCEQATTNNGGPAVNGPAVTEIDTRKTFRGHPMACPKVHELYNEGGFYARPESDRIDNTGHISIINGDTSLRGYPLVTVLDKDAGTLVIALAIKIRKERGFPNNPDLIVHFGSAGIWGDFTTINEAEFRDELNRTDEATAYIRAHDGEILEDIYSEGKLVILYATDRDPEFELPEPYVPRFFSHCYGWVRLVNTEDAIDWSKLRGGTVSIWRFESADFITGLSGEVSIELGGYAVDCSRAISGDSIPVGTNSGGRLSETTEWIETPAGLPNGAEACLDHAAIPLQHFDCMGPLDGRCAIDNEWRLCHFANLTNSIEACPISGLADEFWFSPPGVNR